MKKMNQRGFTLIELLVVIAIIGLLSTLAVVALGSARTKAYDARRVSDLTSLRNALELYYNDNNSYPAGTNATLGGGSYACLGSTGFNTAGSCGANPEMAQVPTDPHGGTYTYTSTGSSYSITATLEGTVNGLSGTIHATPSGIGP